MKSNNFTWNNVIFEQTDGCPMGSPISPVFAEFFLQELEERIVLNHPDIKLFKRYVDDCLACVKIGSTQQVLQDLNNFHPRIQFTYESPVNRTLPFLDLHITWNDNGKIQLQVYRKPTNTGRYLNYNSYHHPSQKLAVIDSLTYRAYAICDKDFLADELKYITTCLQSNGYPKSLIEKRMARMDLKFQNQNNTAPAIDDTKRFILPYMGPLTHRLTGYLRRKLNCTFGYLTGKKMKQFICNYKEKLPPEKIGIYNIPCSQPCPSHYIGETCRPLHLRLQEHERDVKKKNIKSAVALHALENPTHHIDFNSASLIIPERRNFHRKFLESLHIRSAPNAMNQDQGMKLNPIWSSLLIPLVKNP
jgi:hypothetical protein